MSETMQTKEPQQLTGCPHCRITTGQTKAGNNAGKQRFKCSHCKRRYTAEPRQRGYSKAKQQEALALHATGIGIREIGRKLGINPQTVVNWLHRTSDTGSSNVIPHESTEAVSTTGKAAFPVSEKRRATISDVAREAGVSNATVSNYLNKKGHMSEETSHRIEATIAKLHFTPNALMRAIQRRQTHIIGVLIFGIYDLDENIGKSIANTLLTGIHRAAAQAGYNVLIYTGYFYYLEETPHLEFLDGHTDGLLWVAPNLEEPALEKVVKAGLPTVAALTRYVPEGTGWIDTDNIKAMYDVISHLVALGHRRIAYASPIYSGNFRDRREGYRRALTAFGIPFDPALEYCPIDDPWNYSNYIRTLDTYLALPSPPTALFAASDDMAGMMIEQLQKRGLRVPEDMSVVGFDDVLDARHIGGGLTTVRQPLRHIGELAVERLVALINGVPAEQCHISVSSTLIVRNTTVKKI